METEYFGWEKEIFRIDRQIFELERCYKRTGVDYSVDILELEKVKTKKLKEIYSNLSAWNVVEVARHPKRPVMKDYLENIVSDFEEMHGDRCFGDDEAVVCGLGKIGSYKVMVVGHNKRGFKLGYDFKSEADSREKLRVYSGCPNPEGFKKVLAKMRFAEKFGIPIVSFIDTPGAYPGIEAEERGQAYAISQNLKKMSRLRVPIVSILIGEGGSGGALGLAVANYFGALEYSHYSVISPEGAAAILWKNKGKMEAEALKMDVIKEVAEALKMTARHAYKLGAIDNIIREPLGGAHRDPRGAAENVKKYLMKKLRKLGRMPAEKLVSQRYSAIDRRAEGRKKLSFWKK